MESSHFTGTEYSELIRKTEVDNRKNGKSRCLRTINVDWFKRVGTGHYDEIPVIIGGVWEDD